MKNDNKKFYSDNDILNKIFEQRENEIYNISQNERELLAHKTKEYSNIFISIDNIPNGFAETRKCITNSIEKFLETTNEIQGIENEKFYKEGFSDAIKLIFNCIRKDIDSTKKNFKY